MIISEKRERTFFLTLRLELKMIKKAKILLLSILCIIIFNSNCTVYAQNNIVLPSGLGQSDIQSTIDSYANNHEDTTAGVSISIFNGQDTLFRGNYGYADIKKQVPIDEDTVFEWGSTTKILVWISVLQLWEQDKIDFNQDIRDYLPEGFLTKANPDEKITMLNLMHHDAGWQEVYNDFLVKDMQRFEGLEESLRKTEPEQVYSVGEVKAYSNWGTALAAYIVEQITGQEFYRYVNENIFIPLDMKRTALRPDLNDNLWVKERRKHIRGYTYDKKVVYRDFYHIPLYPAGMATGTMEDFEKLGKALTVDNKSQKLFRNGDTLEYFLKPTLYYEDTEYPRNSNGLWTEEWGVRTLGHGGNTIAFSSKLLVDPVSKTGVVVMTNQKYEEIYNFGVMELVFGEFHPDVSKFFEPRIEEINGTYQSGRTILKGHGKLDTLMKRLKVEVINPSELKVKMRSGTYRAYKVAPFIYNLEGSLFYIQGGKQGSATVSISHGDFYKISQDQVFKENMLIGTAILTILYSIIMLISKFISFISFKKRKISPIKNPIEKYYLFMLFVPLFAIINMFIMYFKIIVYSPLESLKLNIYLYFGFMIIPLIYNIALPFILKKWEVTKKTKVKYIITGIVGCIISLNIYYWQLFLI